MRITKADYSQDKNLDFVFCFSSRTHFDIFLELVEAVKQFPECRISFGLNLRGHGGHPVFKREEVDAVFGRSVFLRPRNFFDKVRGRMERALSRWFWKSIHSRIKFPRDFEPFEIRREGTVVFLCNDRSPVQQQCVRHFKKMGARVCLVQESLRRDDTMKMVRNFVAHGQGGCDKIYAIGESSRDYFDRVGVSPDRVSVVGSPRLDRFVRHFRGLGEGVQLRKRFALPPDGPVVLFASNPVYNMMLEEPLEFETYLEQVRELVHWTRTLGGTVLWKPHPLELYRLRPMVGALVDASNGILRFEPDIPLAEALRVCDTVLINNSTVAVEAGLVGVTSGLLFPDSYSHGTDFIERGLSMAVSSLEELRILLEKDFGPSQTQAVHHYVESTEGSALKIIEQEMQLLS